jgi:protocatechuate 3,4-dioxygenase alpha subunit
VTPRLPETPGQTVGPFFGYALPYDGGPALAPLGHRDAFTLHGHVYDGAGSPVPDALVEIWQPDQHGRVMAKQGSLHRDGYDFTGWGRAATDNTGRYHFRTFSPRSPRAGGAAFFAMTVFARGLLDRLFTRAYLPGNDEALSTDPLLVSVGDRWRTLIAIPDTHGLLFDIRLQGDDETVFLSFTQP